MVSMEPASAFALALNVLSVVQISADIVSAACTVYDTGRLKRYDSLKGLAEDLQVQNATLIAPATHGGNLQHDAALAKITRQCNEVALELLQILAKLEPTGRKQLIKSLEIGVRTWWSHEKIERTAKQLQILRDEIALHILLLVDENVLLVKEQGGQLFQQQRQLFDVLDVRQKEVLQALLHSKNAHQKASEELSRKLDDILKILNRVDISASTSPVWTESTLRPSPSIDVSGVLQWLQFSSRTDRRDTTKKAHQKTFEWIFETAKEIGSEGQRYQTTEDQRFMTGFPEFLENEDGAFWIYGKPGCGKSTLMKFLIDDTRTYNGLRIWAADKPLIVCSFYFWSSGTELQRSLEGLYRGLLYDLISQRTELAETAFPGFGHVPHREPLLSELQASLKRIFTPDRHNFRLCIFVDGVDEYKGDNIELASLTKYFLALAHSQDVKIILASRPLPAIRNMICNCRSLAVHTLTRRDIETYIKDKFASHPTMIELLQQNPHDASRLVRAVSSQASGVFLWVRFAVSTLLDGVGNLETLQELFERLEELPSDLADLYKHMFAKILPSHRSTAAKILLLLLLEQPCGFPISTVRLSFMLENGPEYAFNYPIEPMSARTVLKRSNDVSKLVQSRCLGLVEVTGELKRVHVDQEMSAEAHEEAWGQKCRMNFIHRSAVDFVRREDVQRSLMDAAGPTFDPWLVEIRSGIIQAKTMPLPYTFLNRVREIVAWKCARYEMNRSPCIRELDEMERTAHHFYYADLGAAQSVYYVHNTLRHYPDCFWSHPGMSDVRLLGTFTDTLSYAIYAGAFHYVKSKLETNSSILSNQKGRLYYATQRRRSLYSHAVPDVRMVQILLDLGVSPNEEFNGSSAWQAALRTTLEVVKLCAESAVHYAKHFMLGLIPVLYKLLDAGGDPNCMCRLFDIATDTVSASVVIEALGHYVQDMANGTHPEALQISPEIMHEIEERNKALQQKFKQTKAEADRKLLEPPQHDKPIKTTREKGSSWRATAISKVKGWKKGTATS